MPHVRLVTECMQANPWETKGPCVYPPFDPSYFWKGHRGGVGMLGMRHSVSDAHMSVHVDIRGRGKCYQTRA